MSLQDRFGSANHAPKLCASGNKGKIDIPAVEIKVGDGPESTTFWPLTAGLPVSPEGPAEDAWQGIEFSNCNLLATDDCGASWARVRRQCVAHFQPMSLMAQRKRNCSFFENVVTAGPWPIVEQSTGKILHPALLRDMCEDRCAGLDIVSARSRATTGGNPQ